MDFITPEDLPPELRAQFEAFQMQSEQTAHDIRDLFTTLTEHQLRILRTLIRTMDGNSSACGYYAGVTSSALSSRFGVCLGCGKKHDDELKEMSGQSEPAKHVHWADFVASLDSEMLDNLSKYHMNLIPDEWPVVACARCGHRYPSIQDRMLRKPDECATCVQKAKWG